MFLNAGSNGKYVRIEHDVVGVEIQALPQQVMTALTYGNTSLKIVRLTVLIEGHNDHRGTVALA